MTTDDVCRALVAIAPWIALGEVAIGSVMIGAGMPVRGLACMAAALVTALQILPDRRRR